MFNPTLLSSFILLLFSWSHSYNWIRCYFKTFWFVSVRCFPYFHFYYILFSTFYLCYKVNQLPEWLAVSGRVQLLAPFLEPRLVSSFFSELILTVILLLRKLQEKNKKNLTLIVSTFHNMLSFKMFRFDLQFQTSLGNYRSLFSNKYSQFYICIYFFFLCFNFCKFILSHFLIRDHKDINTAHRNMRIYFNAILFCNR